MRLRVEKIKKSEVWQSKQNTAGIKAAGEETNNSKLKKNNNQAAVMSLSHTEGGTDMKCWQ